MKVTFDPPKQAWTLADRGLDFNDFPELYAQKVVEYVDDRFDYGELREVAVGWLRGRLIVAVFSRRDSGYHVISMRKANDREKARYLSKG